jgi:hypothetical protein
MRSGALDLEEGTLVDIAVVRFLGTANHKASSCDAALLTFESGFSERVPGTITISRPARTSNKLRISCGGWSVKVMTFYSTEFHFASEDGSRAACTGPWTALIPSSCIVRITDAWASIWHAPPEACEAEQPPKCLAHTR